MGTRCLTRITDEAGLVYANLYRHFDGYPDAMGDDLCEFLRGKKCVNGISVSDNRHKIFNGAGDLSGGLVAWLRNVKNVDVCVYPVSFDDCNQEYEYTITFAEGCEPRFKCDNLDGKVWDGSPSDFDGEKWMRDAYPVDCI